MRTFLAVTSAALLSSPLHAADITPGDTIIVTATRTEIPLRDATVPVTVITREDIELSLARDLAELLRFEADIDIGRSGGPGQSTSLFLRGTESNHTLVLIDGVRMNPGTIGGAAIQNIAPELIERVEIVKGARSALFGTDAIGGVINIITRRVDKTYAEGGLGAGSFDSRSGHVSGGSRSDRGEFGASLNWQQTDGYAPRVDSDVDRGYDNLSLNLYGTRDFGAHEFSVRHWRAEGNVEYLDFFLTAVTRIMKTRLRPLDSTRKCRTPAAASCCCPTCRTTFGSNSRPTSSSRSASASTGNTVTRSSITPCRAEFTSLPRRRGPCHSVPVSTRTLTFVPYSCRTSSSSADRRRLQPFA